MPGRGLIPVSLCAHACGARRRAPDDRRGRRGARATAPPSRSAPTRHAAMQRSAEVVDRLADSSEPAYGVSTGFGSLATVRIAPERREELQRALIRSHAAGMGPPVEREVVRAMMLLRARTLAMGYSGARPVIAETILALLNAGITPVVPEHGSLGASGDLAPLAHCALALIGEGQTRRRRGRRRPAADALGAGSSRCRLTAKEGLALINGTDGSLGMLAMALHDLERPAERRRHHRRDVGRGAARHRPGVRCRPARAAPTARAGGQRRQHPARCSPARRSSPATATATRASRTPTRCDARRR